MRFAKAGRLLIPAAVLALTLFGQVEAARWVAYNDCLKETGDSTHPNATIWTIHNNDFDHSTGRLKNFETGSDTGMPTVTFSMNADAGLRVSSGGAGGYFAAGTDAYEIFNGKVDFAPNNIYYGAPGWWAEIDFSDLDPTKMYTFVGTALRSSNYPLRISLFTISGAVSYVNNSSDGIYEKNADTTKLLAGDNSTTGYVVRWDEIIPAPDGTFKIRAEATADSDAGKAYPFAGFMLEEVGNAGNRVPEVEAGQYSSRTWPSNIVQLDGSVWDDDPCGFGILNLQWSKVTGPGSVTFLPGDDIEDPCALFSAPGEYELILQAWDEVPQEANDVASITIVAPSCPVGDLNGDCVVDFNDLMVFSGQWLDDPGCSGFGCPDFDGLHGVGVRDYSFLADNWLQEWLGSICVTLHPQAAVQAGAQWRVDSGLWRDSGQSADGLPVGPHTIDFKQIQDWIKPDEKLVEVYIDQTSAADGTYVELPESPLIISEFMAINSYVPRYNPLNLYTRVEGRNEYPDWIEIHNLGLDTVSLDGWYLTDDKNSLRKWQFPNGYSIVPGGYFVVYASNKDSVRFPGNYPYVDDSGNLHTNFELNGDGEYLALVQPDGLSVAYEYLTYPNQRGLISYGRSPTGQIGYLKSVSRETTNSDIYDGVVSDTKFSVDRGFYDNPFYVELSCPTPGAQIRYTTDGSEPSPTNGTTYDGNSPILIATTTYLRAAAFKADWLPTNIDTHTFIFLNHVIQQATDPGTGAQVVPPDCPTTWPGGSYSGAVTGDYQVDPDVVGPYIGTIRNDFKAIPTLSVVMDRDDWFGAEGIYVNQSQDGTERACSTEFFDAQGNEEFQLNCGVQMQGGVSGGGTSLDRWKSYKCSMRLVFKGGYGPAKLRYRFFGDEDAADVFDTLVLDARLNNVWVHPSGSQQIKGQYTRDQYPSDVQNAMGGYGTHGRPVHLYVSGLYWGLYWAHERPDHRFAAAYLGGEPEDYDAIKHNSGLVLNGSNQTYNEMFAVPASNYDLMKEYLDVPNFIDYMIMNFYIGNTDWSHKNWYATHNRHDPGGRWRYHSWDPEHCLKSLTEDVTGKNQSGSPTGLHQKLLANEEYRMDFADRVHKHFFNDGVLSPTNAEALYQNILDQIDRAVVGESARWGDNRRSTPYTRDVEWVNQRDWLLNTYFPGRTNEVLTQFRDEKSPAWYPSVAAPVFTPHGGWSATGFNVIMTNPNGTGTMWYTTDGADPRLPGGSVNLSHAAAYSGPLSLSESTHVKARVLDGSTWSALNEAVYGVGPVADFLRITEIMYHPQDTQNPHDPNEEFIELMNIGSPQPLKLNLVKFTRGIHFTFPSIELDAGEYLLVVKNQTAFDAQYPAFSGVIAGEYTGSLANDGERIKLADARGETILDFRFKDGWYDVTDGLGFSLTIRDAEAIDPCNWDQKESWGASTNWGGSPGEGDDGPKVGDIVITEILAHSDVEVYDWVELHNTTDSTINIGGWFLSDSGGNDANLMKYQLPADTTLGQDGYYVITEAQFGDMNDPGCHVPFALSENGEKIYLSSGIPDELTLGGFRDDREFGASDRDVAFGLYTKSGLSAIAGDPTDFVAMSQSTKNSANTYPPKVGPIVIAEIMYHPAGSADPEEEYIKLVNISDSAVTLQRYDPNCVKWKFTDGIRYTFPPDTTIAAGDYIYVVYDPAAFSAAYPAVPSGKIFGPFENDDGGERTKLDNAGEDVELSKPGDSDDVTGERFYILIDRVNYSDGSHPRDGYIDPWPTQPDGGGQSLHRITLDEYGNDVVNWQASPPSPGG